MTAGRRAKCNSELKLSDLRRFNLSRAHILGWLKETDPEQLKQLFDWADQVRKDNVGDAVHLRGLIEFSNVCRCDCLYCGLRKSNAKLKRYVLSEEEIFACVQKAVKFGYGTVVLQSGESPVYSAEHLANIIKKIKQDTGLAVTLSIGERSLEEYKLLKSAGADRYLLRQETSDLELLHHIRPVSLYEKRIDALRNLKSIGFETGSGIMVGIPGQSFESVASDIMLFAELDLEMIGIGPYIEHPDTPLAQEASKIGNEQVPSTEMMTVKAVALTRIMCPESNIPATTALGTINKTSGREAALQAGANVVMPNITPVQYRKLYEIYPAKACIEESGDECNLCIKSRILSIGRTVGTGPGSRVNFKKVQQL
jgi:biotin synthase